MRTLILTAALLLAAIPATAVVDPAQSAEENGLAVAREADRRDTGWGANQSELKMVLRNRQGQESEREMRNRALEVEGDGDKSLVIFDTPRDVKGTAFLTFAHKDGNDDQWLYLPALKRVKRIASNNKSGPFMGSEFAYEDISSQEVEEYTYTYLRTEELDGRTCHVVEQIPVDKKSGYTKQIVWYDDQEYRVWKTEYYDRKDELLKTLVFEGYRQYAEAFWRADRLFMENHQTGKSTVLEFTNYEFGVDLDERDFDQSSLARVR